MYSADRVGSRFASNYLSLISLLKLLTPNEKVKDNVDLHQF